MSKFLVKAEVESDFVDERSGVSAKNKPYTIRSQKVWLFLGSKFPKEAVLNLEEGQRAYRPGLYEIDLLPALDIGDFGRVVIDGRRLILQPVMAPAQAAK